MANFYTDNDDIRFLFRHYDLRRLACLVDNDFSEHDQIAWAPVDADDAVDNYDRILDVVGGISGDYIDGRAESVDLDGNTLNDDGTVTYAAGMRDNLKNLSQAQLMGFTLPRRFGGINSPNLLYTMSNEIVSRADAALMNVYGLQGIAETINAFASEEIKQEFLPNLASGEWTGAMVLTEPDAGSDLQAINVRAFQDENGQWLLHGVKRFITNGCGEVLLVLARSELDRTGGLGLSLFVCNSGPTVKVRRLENKLGIHGSPTCEIFFDNTPCKLIGERQRGLVTYVMSLMNGARIGIAAQSLGIGEAAFRVARDYGASREQFGKAIENFPAVRDMLIEMKIDIEVARTLTYETSWIVDHEYNLLRRMALGTVTDKDEKKRLRNEQKKYKRYAAMLTPMSKYYASEMSNRVAYDAIQVLGGSGYMKDYPVERYARDARITTIYEGTSQLQVVAAVRGVCNGSAERFLNEKAAFDYPTDVADLVEILKKCQQSLVDAIAFVKEQPGIDYMDLCGRKLVDVTIMLIVGHMFIQQGIAEALWHDDFTTKTKDDATDNGQPDSYSVVRDHKKIVARRYVTQNAPKITMLCEVIRSGDTSTVTDYDTIVGPVPSE